MRRAGRPGPGQESVEEEEKAKENWSVMLEELKEMKETIVELREGRVLSRKNREIVKNAVTALQDVLKADSAGTSEDEEGKVTERDAEPPMTIEIEKDVEKSGESTEKIIDAALQRALSPERIKKLMDDTIELTRATLRGKVK